MATYCECGCVLMEHDDEGVCYGDGGTCPCEMFEEVPTQQLNAPWE